MCPRHYNAAGCKGALYKTAQCVPGIIMLLVVKDPMSDSTMCPRHYNAAGCKGALYKTAQCVRGIIMLLVVKEPFIRQHNVSQAL